uniref:tudor and KH domain-containing protein n=1 Tax=Podarcis muralis TaxID=64176 RepID=UPI0010A052ED|nr:tudor and KH domain-containing protein [Podarcis muralis]
MASEKGSWSSLTMLQKVALALGVPASGAILYILYRRYRESQEERVTFVGEEELQVEMKVPKDAVKLLIGRHGANVKQLRKETQARIDVDVEDCGEERLIRICGSAVQVCKAKAAIHQILEENMAVTEKILVPQRAVGRIIGRGGETVRAIHQSTGAKIDCDREGSFSLTRQITLSGTRKEVLAAKKLIAEKVLEDEAFHKKLSHSALARSQRKQPLGTRKEDAGGSGDRRGDLPCTGEAFHQPLGTPRQEGAAGKFPEYPPEEPQELRSEGGSSEESLSETSCLSYAFEVPSPDFSFHANEHLEVYVSASESPNHFWIQIIGSRTFQLDKLTREMTQYYDTGTPEGERGDIVAAPYPEDRAWYRARVLGTLGNGNMDLYYVDFGDNGEAPLEKLQLLRSDFLSLPFQAIECGLAGIAPVGESWSEAALDEFDRLTHCAKWKPVLAKISSYLPAGSSTWPHVRLYNTTSGQDIDVGAELVRLGYAVQCLQDGDGGAGDGPDPLDKGAQHRSLGDTTGVSLESLLSDTQKTPDEMPLTLSCLSLSDEPVEGPRDETEPPHCLASTLEGLPPSLESLQLSLPFATPSEGFPSTPRPCEIGDGRGRSNSNPPPETPAQAEAAMELTPLPDVELWAAKAEQASTPSGPGQPGEGASSPWLSSEGSPARRTCQSARRTAAPTLPGATSTTSPRPGTLAIPQSSTAKGPPLSTTSLVARPAAPPAPFLKAAGGKKLPLSRRPVSSSRWTVAP